VAADIIFVIGDGRIVERGTHSELLGQRGLYTALFEEQLAEAMASAGATSPGDRPGDPEPR
jgi:ABC-type transport system involved in cytochrome bd biosynthesis fused ATPase/permease subunit